jgi:hypothetical protein
MRITKIIVLFSLLFSFQTDKYAYTGQKKATDDQRGTETSPLIVKVLPSQKSDGETAQEKQWHQDQSDANWWMVRLTLAYGIVALLQLGVFSLQARRLRQTISKMDEVAKGQTSDMKETIAQAARSAEAMEDVSHSIAVSAKAASESIGLIGRQLELLRMQMRAYITVVISGAIYQEREKNIRFEGKPILLNTGHTPAKKVAYRAKAGILPVSLPDDFDFPLPKQNVAATGGAVVGSQNSMILSAMVDDFVPDQDVDSIKSCSGPKILYCWGVVNYEDVFGEAHETKFCQMLWWLKDEKQTVFGLYCPRHNDAT